MRRRGRLDLALLLGAVVLLVFGTNLQGVLLPIRGHERGAPMLLIGFLSSSWSAGFVLSCLLAGRLIAALGHARLYAVLAMVGAAAALGFAVVARDEIWIALRFASGFCFGGASIVVEGWVLNFAGGASRFAFYMIANLCASIGGTLSLDVIDPAGAAPFLLAGSALATSLVPVALASGAAPPRPVADGAGLRLALLLRASPAAAAGCLLGGAVTGAIGGLAPLFGAMQGLGMSGTTLMLAANSVGGALGYASIARFAHRIDRSVLSGALALAGVVLSAPVVLAPGSLGPPALVLLLGALGAVQYPIYGISVARASSAAPARPTTAIAAEALLLFGGGTIVGPLGGAFFMRTGASHLFLYVGALFGLLFILSAENRSPSGGAARRSLRRSGTGGASRPMSEA